MTIGQTIASLIAVLVLLAIFAYIDREGPEDLEDTEEEEARRHIAGEDE